MSNLQVRVSDGVRTLWKEMADQDGRSMSNYLERLLLREKDRMENGLVTLDTLNIKLDNILDCFSENKKRGVKNSETKEKKHATFDVWEDCGVCTKENWDKWIKHLRNLGKPPTSYLASLQFQGLCNIRKEKWDCDQLIEYIISKGHATFYIPKEWVEEELRFSKNR